GRQHFSDFHDDFVRKRINDVVQTHAADDAFFHGLDDVLAGFECSHRNTVDRAAVFFGDHNVVGHINQTACQVAGVGGLKRRVGQTFPATVSGDKIFED